MHTLLSMYKWGTLGGTCASLNLVSSSDLYLMILLRFLQCTNSEFKVKMWIQDRPNICKNWIYYSADHEFDISFLKFKMLDSLQIKKFFKCSFS